MSTYEPDDGFDALLRDSMRNEAETVMPAGDGLARIQQRVSARRARLRWMRPTLALTSVAVLAIAGIGAYAVVHGDGGTDRVLPVPATQPPTETPTTEPTPSQTTPPPASVAFPKRAIFPFTSAKDERAWEQQAAAGHSPWQGDPRSVATYWVTNFLQLSSVNKFVRQTNFTPSKVDVTLGRMQSDAGSQRQIAVTTVHLVKYAKAWIVTGATDDSRLLRITSPAAGAKVTSPVVASGPGFGADEAAAVQVRAATAPASYGEGHTGSFGVRGWSAHVSFSTPTSSVGVLVVVETSQADSLPSRVTAEQVRFGTSSVSAGPQYFYGIKDARVTKFAARNGAVVDYLTDPQPGGGASDPQLVGSDVYFLRATGPCSQALHKVSTATSDNTPREQPVASPDDGYAITGYAVSTPQRYTYYEQACDGNRSPQAKLVFIDSMNDTSTSKRSIAFQGQPPMVVADPAYEPTSGRAYVDAIVRTGTGSYLARFDEFSTTSPTPSRNACPGYDTNNGRPWALETDASGVIWFATQTGSSMQVWKCAAGSSTAAVAFTVPGNRQPADVDVSSTGSVLLTDTNGDIWRWDGSGDAQQLSPNQPVTDVTW
jgi:hypothetical protein